MRAKRRPRSRGSRSASAASTASRSVDPANEASLRIPRALGFAEEATLRRRLPGREGEARGDAVVFALFADELDRTPVSSAPLEAFDALGRSIPL